MKNYLFIIGCLFVAPSLSKNIAVKSNNLYETVCNQTVANSYESQVDWWGVSGALLPIVLAIPEAIPIEVTGAILGGITGTLSGISGSYVNDGQDYSADVVDCFKRMVHDEINGALLLQATTAVAQTGDDTKGLNEQMASGHPPEEVMEKMGTYYERIVGNQRTVGQLYSAVQKTADKQTESMLHYYLNMLTVQSYAALSISVYAFANFEHSEFESQIELYFKDVRNILGEQFDSENEALGVQHIFDKSDMATQWSGGVEIVMQGCGGETGPWWCGKDRNFCYIHDQYRDLQGWGSMPKCDASCDIFDHWDPCVPECDETACPPEWKTKGKQFVEDTLTGIRTSISDAKKLVEAVVLRIENMLFAKQKNN